MLRCISDFMKMPDTDLVTKCLTVHNSMTGNKAFLTPPVTMAVLAASTQQFSDGIVADQSRDKVKVATKDILRKSLLAEMSQLLAYVNTTANGDKPTLLGSGFTLGKERGKQTLGSFGNVTVTPGKNSGEVLVRYDSVDNAVSYQVELAEYPVQNDNWKVFPEPTTTRLLTGLTRGKEYSIRIVAVGRRLVTATSQVITILVV